MNLSTCCNFATNFIADCWKGKGLHSHCLSNTTQHFTQAGLSSIRRLLAATKIKECCSGCQNTKSLDFKRLVQQCLQHWLACNSWTCVRFDVDFTSFEALSFSSNYSKLLQIPEKHTSRTGTATGWYLRGFHAQHPFQRNHFGWGRNFFCQTTDMAIGMWSPPSLPSFLIKQNKDRNLKLGNNKTYQNVIAYRILKDFSFSNWRKDLILLVGEIEATGVLQSKTPPRAVTIPSGRWSEGKYIQELG